MALIQSGSSADLARVNTSGQLLVSESTRNRTGVYIANTGRLAVQAAAHAGTAGFVWLLNPINSTKLLALRRIEVDAMGVAVAAANTRITAERMTFTGTPTAAQTASAKIDTTMPNPAAYLTGTTTGITPTAGPAMYSFWLMAIITAAGVSEPVETSWNPSEAGMPIVRPGEGIVVRQPDAGVATDPRFVTINLAWEEF